MVATAPASTTSAQLKSDPVGLAGAFAEARLVSNRDPVADQSAVDAAAQSLAERIGSSFAEANGVVRGTPAMRAGTPFSVSVVGDDFQGRYLATTTRHVFDRDGYRTEFSVSGRQDRSLLGLVGARGQGASQGSGAATGLMVAIVTGNEDPERLGRVKLKFPTQSDDYVSSLYPGKGKDYATASKASYMSGMRFRLKQTIPHYILACEDDIKEIDAMAAAIPTTPPAPGISLDYRNDLTLNKNTHTAQEHLLAELKRVQQRVNANKGVQA
jgi:hypothetical protein